MKNLSYFLILSLILYTSCTDNLEKGEELFELGEYFESLEYFELAAQYDPNNYFILYNIARCHEELEDYKEAIDYYSKSIKLNKPFIEGYLGRARCNMNLEKYEYVLVDAENILQIRC